MSGPDGPRVHVDVVEVTLRLALSFVLDDAGFRRTPDAQRADVVVSEQLPPPSSARPLDVLVVRPLPARALAAVDAVSSGRARAALAATDPLALPTTLDALAAGLAVIPQIVVAAASEAPALAERLRDTLRLVQHGCSNGVIARRLHCSQSTVKRDVAELLRLFDAPNRASLAATASALGFNGAR